jgi:acyl-CoA dehydrogenase
MADQSFLSWPFFETAHRDWAARVEEVAKGLEVDHADTDAACRALVTRLGEAGLLQETAARQGA